MVLRRQTIDEELTKYRGRALHFAEVLACGLRFPDLVWTLRHYMEDHICLADEAPDDRQDEINYLIDRFDALQRQMAN